MRRAEPSAGAWLLVAMVSAAFAIGAVALEVLGGVNANSPVPSWGELVPVAWPQPARVMWWLAVAGAAAAFRLALHRLGLRQRPPVVLLSVVPFVAFAVGIAVGASWATWH